MRAMRKALPAARAILRGPVPVPAVGRRLRHERRFVNDVHEGGERVQRERELKGSICDYLFHLSGLEPARDGRDVGASAPAARREGGSGRWLG